MENVVTNILVYYKSIYINYYLKKQRFLHFSRSSDMSSRNADTLQKRYLCHFKLPLPGS